MPTVVQASEPVEASESVEKEPVLEKGVGNDYQKAEYKVLEGLKCAICLDWVQDCVQCNACVSTLFCRQCFEDAYRVSGRCPCCKESSTYSLNEAVQRLVDSAIQEPCEECKQLVFRGNRRDHANLCPMAFIPCSFDGCLTQIRRKEKDEHEQECEFRPVECECGELIMKSKEEQHKNEDCPIQLISCPHNCVATFRREVLASHEAECPNVDVACIHSRVGCEWNNQRRLLRDHLRECNYETMKGFVYEQFEINEDLKRNLEQKEHDLSMMRNRLESAEDMIETLTKEMQALRPILSLFDDSSTQHSNRRNSIPARDSSVYGSTIMSWRQPHYNSNHPHQYASQSLRHNSSNDRASSLLQSRGSLAATNSEAR